MELQQPCWLACQSLLTDAGLLCVQVAIKVWTSTCAWLQQFACLFCKRLRLLLQTDTCVLNCVPAVPGEGVR